MIYLDTSVALAQLLGEDRAPPETLWQEELVSSRLLEYELWVRIHARGLGGSHHEGVRQLLSRVAFIEMAPPVLERALEPFPVAVRTLDALHLASVQFLIERGQKVALATYDGRLAAAARKLSVPLVDLMGGPARSPRARSRRPR